MRPGSGAYHSGSTPTTHILEPPAQPDLDGFDINEHFCLKLAGALGLEVAASTLLSFAGVQALVIERYDRLLLAAGRITRLHQEDACQALAISPLQRYENDGGPGAARIVALLLRESDDPAADVGTFLDALVLNWVIGGTDAHAKNYSLLIAADQRSSLPAKDFIIAKPA